MEDNNGSGVALSVPVGFRFNPTNSEILINYLLNKVRGLPMPCDFAIIDCDLYDGKDRWKKMFEGMDTTSRYFFTKLKKMTVNGNRIQRQTGGGTWKETQKERNVYSNNSQPIGTKKCFKFVAPEGSGRWLMDEYRLNPCFLHPTMDEYVVCHIKHEKEMKSKSNGKNHEEENCTANILVPLTTTTTNLNNSSVWAYNNNNECAQAASTVEDQNCMTDDSNLCMTEEELEFYLHDDNNGYGHQIMVQGSDHCNITAAATTRATEPDSGSVWTNAQELEDYLCEADNEYDQDASMVQQNNSSITAHAETNCTATTATRSSIWTITPSQLQSSACFVGLAP